jgi:hypothetical protein
MSPTTELQRMTHSPLHLMLRQMPCQAAPSRSHCSGAAASASSLACEARQPKEDALSQPATPRSQDLLPSPRASSRRQSPCHGHQRGPQHLHAVQAPSNGQPEPSPPGPPGPRSSSPRPSSARAAARPQPRHRIHAPERHHALCLHRSRPAAMDEPRLKQRSLCRGEYRPATTFPGARGLRRHPLWRQRCGGGWEGDG